MSLMTVVVASVCLAKVIVIIAGLVGVIDGCIIGCRSRRWWRWWPLTLMLVASSRWWLPSLLTMAMVVACIVNVGGRHHH